jgi:oligopeptide/dipeptide ABC transporter ATP-binding protein
VPDPEIESARDPILLQGEIPSPVNPPSGCRFHTRCPIARVPGVCSETEPELEPHGRTGQSAACHFAGQEIG